MTKEEKGLKTRRVHTATDADAYVRYIRPAGGRCDSSVLLRTRGEKKTVETRRLPERPLQLDKPRRAS